MPEGNIVLQIVDILQRRLCLEGKWFYFQGINQYGTRFDHIDIKPLNRAIGHRIEDIFCKGKTFFMLFADNLSISSHLGMQGAWSFETDGKNTHFELRLSENSNPKEEDIVKIYYNNQRFGKFKVMQTKEECLADVNEIAPGFIGRFRLTEEEWMQRISRFTKKKSVMKLLMDQKDLCSGIGNFLVAEIMWYAKLHPQVLLGSLDDGYKRLLFEVCCKVVMGHYDRTLPKVIYMKELDPLGNKIIQQKFTDRTTHWVPEVQTLI